MQLDHSCTDIVDWQSHCWRNSSCHKQSQRIHPSILPKSREKTFFKVIVRTSERHIVEEMSENVSFQALPSLARNQQLIECLEDVLRVPSSPFRFNLSIKCLPNWNNSERVRHDCSGNACNSSDQCLLSVAEIIIRFGWFDLVVDNGVDSVSDEEISESAIEMGIESLVQAR